MNSNNKNILNITYYSIDEINENKFKVLTLAKLEKNYSNLY
jgi:hypothetical protein